MPKYVFEEAPLTCVALENELGVRRGSIVSLTISPEGAVEVDTKETWTDDGQKQIRAALVKRGLGKGKTAKEG
uniref:Uncharacterized protein n=1 Tax=viral metagenome TaxID=1070528 RepID=A0A6M3LID7_9ZZZZ